MIPSTHSHNELMKKDLLSKLKKKKKKFIWIRISFLLQFLHQIIVRQRERTRVTRKEPPILVGGIPFCASGKSFSSIIAFAILPVGIQKVNGRQIQIENENLQLWWSFRIGHELQWLSFHHLRVVAVTNNRKTSTDRNRKQKKICERSTKNHWWFPKWPEIRRSSLFLCLWRV